MAKVRVHVDIDASPETVWSVVEPVEDHVDWMADAVAIRFTGDTIRGVGTRYDCDTKVGPLKLTDRMSITRWDPARAMGVRHEGVVTGTGEFTLDALDGGRRTRFTWEESLRFPRWMGGRVGAVVGARVMERIWRRNLHRLRAIVEAAPAVTPQL